MISIRSRFFGAGLLGLCAFAILAGHERLAHVLLQPCAGAGLPRPVGFASVSASLLVHVLTGVWLLPAALRLERLGVRADSVRAALWCALVAMFARAVFEASSGVSVRGLPFLGVAFTIAVWTWLRERPAVAAASSARRARAASAMRSVEPAARREAS